jgi:hypothetical protein
MRMKNRTFELTPKQSICSTGHRLRNGSVSALYSVGNSCWVGAAAVPREKRRKNSMVVLRNSKITVNQSADVATVFQDLLRLEDRIDQDKEHFYGMHVNSRQQINHLLIVYTELYM